MLQNQYMAYNMSNGLNKEENYIHRHILIKYREEIFMNMVIFFSIPFTL